MVIPRPVAGFLVDEVDALCGFVVLNPVLLAVIGEETRSRIDISNRNVRQDSDRRLRPCGKPKVPISQLVAGAGYFSVWIYKRRTGQRLNVRGGARMGGSPASSVALC